MKTITHFLISMLIILTACTTSLSVPYSFEDGFEEFKKIDEKYNTSFHTEELNSSIVAWNDIAPMRDEVKRLKNRIDDTASENDNKFTNHSDALSLFAEIRLLMLESEAYWHQARKIGNLGLVTDPTGFRCNEARYILEATNYYNRSYTAAIFAQRKIDDLLIYYKEIPQLRELIGINENKTRFFKSPLWWLKNAARDNVDALKKNCGFDDISLT